jgi:hypothetical protein
VAGQKHFTIREWVIILGLTASAVGVSELFGFAQEWKDVLVYTVVVFAVVLTALRPAWGRKAFWSSFALVLAGHVVIVLVSLHALPPGRFGIPKLLLVLLGGIEGVLIAAILRRRMVALRTQGIRIVPL